MSRQRVGTALTAALAAVVTVTVVGAPAASALPVADPSPPGGYVQELPAFGDSIVGVDVTVPLVVGAGIPNPQQPDRGRAGQPFSVASLADFQAEVVDPSPRLAAGVAAYFAINDATPLLLRLTPNESASTLTAAVTSASADDGYGLLTVPALGQLDGSDYLTVATAMDVTAQSKHAVALLDPPDAVVEQAVAQGAGPLGTLAGQLDRQLPAPTSAMFFSSGLQNSQRQGVPASLTVAGLIGANAVSRGVSTNAGGMAEPLTGLTPVWAAPNAAMGALEIAKVNPFRSMPGYGTLLWGYATLTAPLGQPVANNAGVRLFVNQVDQSVAAALAAYTFAANDSTTWSQITRSISGYLTAQWQSGGLQGATAAQAFDVSCGVGLTMTPQDVLNGTLKVVITMNVVDGSPPVTLSVTQEMAGP